jgi:hypothetical protein
LPPGGAVAPDEPLSAMQPCKACCCESHPTNCTMPESKQVGCNDSMQRRYPSASVTQDGVIEVTAAQLIGQSAATEQPVWAIFAQVAEHEAETWEAEQLSPHVANGPASPSWLLSAAPPQPSADQSASTVAPEKMQNVFIRPPTSSMLVTIRCLRQSRPQTFQAGA